MKSLDGCLVCDKCFMPIKEEEGYNSSGEKDRWDGPKGIYHKECLPLESQIKINVFNDVFDKKSENKEIQINKDFSSWSSASKTISQILQNSPSLTKYDKVITMSANIKTNDDENNVQKYDPKNLTITIKNFSREHAQILKRIYDPINPEGPYTDPLPKELVDFVKIGPDGYRLNTFGQKALSSYLINESLFELEQQQVIKNSYIKKHLHLEKQSESYNEQYLSKYPRAIYGHGSSKYNPTLYTPHYEKSSFDEFIKAMEGLNEEEIDRALLLAGATPVPEEQFNLKDDYLVTVVNHYIAEQTYHKILDNFKKLQLGKM